MKEIAGRPISRLSTVTGSKSSHDPGHVLYFDQGAFIGAVDDHLLDLLRISKLRERDDIAFAGVRFERPACRPDVPRLNCPDDFFDRDLVLLQFLRDGLDAYFPIEITKTLHIRDTRHFLQFGLEMPSRFAEIRIRDLAGQPDLDNREDLGRDLDDAR